MTTQSQATWWRASLPAVRSLPYFIPAWLVFAYVGVSSAFDWPELYVGIFFVLALLFSQVPRLLHGVTLRQWFIAAVVLPSIATVLLSQAIKLAAHSP
jgi:hypothetical protein